MRVARMLGLAVLLAAVAAPVVPVHLASEPVAQDTTSQAGVGPTLDGAPVIAASLRGLGVGALMGAVGLLALLAWLLPSGGDGPRRSATVLVWAAVVFLALHAVAWLCDAVGSWHLDADALALLTGTTTGRTELVRVSATLLTAVLAAAVRRPGVAAVVGIVALVASADVGHAAAIATAWSLPLKAIHLAAGAAWLGGLLWLLRADVALPDHATGVARVSAAALVAVIAVTLSGLVTALLFLPAVRDLFHSDYGSVAIAKTVGVGVLALFGAYHKFVLVPRAAAPDAASGLRRSVRYEIAVMIFVILLGGLLAYVSPPDAGA